MKFIPCNIEGQYLITPEKICDNRGYFARTLDSQILEEHNLESKFVQQSIAYNKSRNIIRGMHFQRAPYSEVKLVRVLSGVIFDVTVDLRKNSPTFCQYYIKELSADNHEILYIPKGVAHGYLTLTDQSTIMYDMSEFYKPEYYTGVRWSDNAFNIPWPIQNDKIIITEKDNSFPLFNKLNDIRVF